MSKRPKYQHPMLLDRARRLRHDATVPENVLWGILRGGRLGGLKFRRQYPIGPYIVDFYCHSARLVVELDGNSHLDKSEPDNQRTAFLRQQGLQVFRVTNGDLRDNLEAVARGIAREAGIDLENL